MRIVLDTQDIEALVSGQLVEKEALNREGDVEQVQVIPDGPRLGRPRAIHEPGNHTNQLG